ncbi:MAG: helix-turn-helix domain-containing protein [Candidatus Omnitrophica bacterium]|nr:helix-turn-helix domain-containing protein [Candidatus Omnitrophota bacterium]
MKRKALKNIPKPDEEKLAIFYGKKATPAETPKREPEMSTVDKKTTVDKMSTVVNEDLLRDKLKLLITPGQQAVYLSLYKRASGSGKDTTDWIGYGELAKESGISLKTVQRAVDRLISASLIKRLDLTNTAEIKGSQYQVILPEGMSTVDKKTTVDKMSTVVNEPKTDVVY